MENVKGTMALGSAGAVAKGLHSYFMSEHSVASGDIKVGNFVQTDITKTDCIKDVTAGVTGKIVGVALKGAYKDAVNTTDSYSAGENVEYIIKGAVFVKSPVVATKNQFVFVNTSTGALNVSNTNTLASHTYTGFKVLIGCDSADSMIAIISE